eukprot:scaffold139773_cov32-Tisochrysis_lutea.AAC.1
MHWPQLLDWDHRIYNLSIESLRAPASLLIWSSFHQHVRVTSGQMEKVRAYIQSGIDEGAKILTGGSSRPAHLGRGYFVQPTQLLYNKREEVLQSSGIRRSRSPSAQCGAYARLESSQRPWPSSLQVFVDVKAHHRIWREEIFGPVLSVMQFTNEQEAITLANDSEYGLAGKIWEVSGVLRLFTASFAYVLVQLSQKTRSAVGMLLRT